MIEKSKDYVINIGLPLKTTGYHPYLGEDGYEYWFEVKDGLIYVVGVVDKDHKEVSMSISEIEKRWGWNVNLIDARKRLIE